MFLVYVFADVDHLFLALEACLFGVNFEAAGFADVEGQVGGGVFGRQFLQANRTLSLLGGVRPVVFVAHVHIIGSFILNCIAEFEKSKYSQLHSKNAQPSQLRHPLLRRELPRAQLLLLPHLVQR